MRSGISDFLVHWTSGDDDEEAYIRLLNILLEMSISANNEKIKGGYYCVCFTEAPELEFHKIKSRYRPFDIQVPKKWLFEKGGRPVIYQSDGEYELLPHELRWRHVRYEPNESPPIDFTWEREWRYPNHELKLDQWYLRVLLPSEEWFEQLVNDYTDDQQLENFWRSCTYGEQYDGPGEEGFLLEYSIINS